ncbi:MAG TPA: PAS domain-containing sensor histidine kinase [Longimicrobiales bacterium]
MEPSEPERTNPAPDEERPGQPQRRRVAQRRGRRVRGGDAARTGRARDPRSRDLEFERELGLHEREHLLRELVDNIREIFWITTPDKDRTLYVSPGYDRIWGRSRRQLYEEPMSWLDAIHPEDRDRVARMVPRQPRGTYDVEYRIVRPDGGIRWIHDRAYPVRGPGGDVERVVGIAEDITDRKRIEESARRLLRAQAGRSAAEAAERSARFLADAGTALSSSLDYAETLGIVAKLAVKDLATYCIVDVIREHTTGLERVATVHRDPELQPLLDQVAEYAPAPGHPAYEVCRTGRSLLIAEVDGAMIGRFAHDAAHRATIDRLAPKSALIVPLIARGRVLGTITLASTERTFDENDLQLAEELGRRAALAVDNARLYRDAVEANRAKSDFLSVMSHELRTPLTAIVGHEDLLEAGLAGPLTDDQIAHLQRIKLSALHLRDLIEEILTYSRLETGRERLRAERIDVADVAREAAEAVGPAATAKGIRFQVDLPHAPVELETDPGKLRRVLLNLLNNAVTFTDKGHIRLTLVRRDGGVAFGVEDTGIGIAPESLERIFAPFWQEQRGLTREVSGTGLGLAVARRLARMLGGDVTVRSTPGLGSTFTVELPRTPPVEGRDGEERVGE